MGRRRIGGVAAMALSSLAHQGGPSSPLPEGWETLVDDKSGKAYFCNRATKESRWDPPKAD